MFPATIPRLPFPASLQCSSRLALRVSGLIPTNGLTRGGSEATPSSRERDTSQCWSIQPSEPPIFRGTGLVVIRPCCPVEGLLVATASGDCIVHVACSPNFLAFARLGATRNHTKSYVNNRKKKLTEEENYRWIKAATGELNYQQNEGNGLCNGRIPNLYKRHCAKPHALSIPVCRHCCATAILQKPERLG